jgi:hypothetical protein
MEAKLKNLFIFFFLIFALIISGCGLANSYYLVRSFDMNEVQIASV